MVRPSVNLSDLPCGWFNPGDIDWYREIYQQIPECGVTAEIGCHRGRSICSVADIIRDRKLLAYCVDKWEPWGFDSSPHVLCAFLDAVGKAGLELSWHISVQRGASLAVAQYLDPECLDFAFIDADHHYASVKSDIEAWEPKVKPGGWIGGHDYFNLECPDVMRAVDERYGNRVLTRMDSLIWLVQL